MNYAILFERIGGRAPCTTFTQVPAGESPTEELSAFFQVMDTIGAPYHPIFNSDAIAVRLEGANEPGYVWSVRVVAVGDEEDTQIDMAAVELDTMELSK